MITTEKRNAMRDAIAANLERKAHGLAVEFKTHSKTMLRLMVEYWRDRALKAERP